MIEEIVKTEGVDRDKLEKNINQGRLVIVKSSVRDIRPLAIGAGVKTKINANIGISPDKKDLKEEINKAIAAVEAGADTIMDLSVGGDLSAIRKKIIDKVKVPLGTVPIYQVFAEKRIDFKLEDYLRVLEEQCRDGIDFATIHSGVTQEAVRHSKKRIIPMTSRGGCFIASWMKKHGQENPLYTGYEDILEILKEYDVTISLGDGLRPGCISDATDKAQITELKTLGELTKRARENNVKVIVEGPGHVPLDQIEENMRLQKKICDNAPFYVLGPLVTDIAVGYDHITSAIGGAIAGMHGADFLCYVTPSEHLGLPTIEDVKEGVIASKIAAHAADIVKLKDTSRDDKMAHARSCLDWDKMFSTALDPTIKDKYSDLGKADECSMCGEYCALKVLKDI